MITEITQDILEKLTKEERVVYSVFKNAVTRNITAYNEDPSATRKNNLDVAEVALSKIVADLTRKYSPSEESSAPGRDFMMEWSEFKETKNRADVLRQLIDLGYEITQRTFYRHCGQGKCRKSKGNVYTRRLVKQYIEAEGIVRSGESSGDQSGPDIALSINKQKLENEKLRIDNETRSVKLKKITGQLIDREALYLELAARVVTLDNGFKQKLEMALPELIAVVGGNPSRQVEFLEMLMRFWNELLNSFATTEEFEVLFEEDSEGVDSIAKELEEIEE